ncbi:MAG: RsmD family RNA methyltransferase [Acidobacteriota bacterium]
MRIVAGELRGRRLRGADHLRPTGERTRAALFDILGGDVGGTFVDLFAGVGSVGLEAVSRGARAILVDRDPRSLEVMEENVLELGVSEDVEIVDSDAFRYAKLAPGCTEPVPIVFADPPYDHPAMDKLLRVLSRSPLVDLGTRIVLQHGRDRKPGRKAPDLELQRQVRHGDAVLSFFSLTREAADARARGDASPADDG